MGDYGTVDARDTHDGEDHADFVAVDFADAERTRHEHEVPRLKATCIKSSVLSLTVTLNVGSPLTVVPLTGVISPLIAAFSSGVTKFITLLVTFPIISEAVNTN